MAQATEVFCHSPIREARFELVPRPLGIPFGDRPLGDLLRSAFDCCPKDPDEPRAPRYSESPETRFFAAVKAIGALRAILADELLDGPIIMREPQRQLSERDYQFGPIELELYPTRFRPTRSLTIKISTPASGPRLTQVDLRGDPRPLILLEEDCTHVEAAPPNRTPLVYQEAAQRALEASGLESEMMRKEFLRLDPGEIDRRLDNDPAVHLDLKSYNEGLIRAYRILPTPRPSGPDTAPRPRRTGLSAWISRLREASRDAGLTEAPRPAIDASGFSFDIELKEDVLAVGDAELARRVRSLLFDASERGACEEVERELYRALGEAIGAMAIGYRLFDLVTSDSAPDPEFAAFTAHARFLPDFYNTARLISLHCPGAGCPLYFRKTTYATDPLWGQLDASLFCAHYQILKEDFEGYRNAVRDILRRRGESRSFFTESYSRYSEPPRDPIAVRRSQPQHRSVFLSHSSLDKPFVRKLRSALQEYGLEVWLDEADLRIGDLHEDLIDQAIARSKNLLVIISRNSVRSAWVQYELEIAEQRGVRAVPVLIDDIDSQLPPSIGRRIYADFRDPARFAESVAQLVRPLDLDDRFEDLYERYLEVNRETDRSLDRTENLQAKHERLDLRRLLTHLQDYPQLDHEPGRRWLLWELTHWIAGPKSVFEVRMGRDCGNPHLMTLSVDQPHLRLQRQFLWPDATFTPDYGGVYKLECDLKTDGYNAYANTTGKRDFLPDQFPAWNDWGPSTNPFGGRIDERMAPILEVIHERIADPQTPRGVKFLRAFHDIVLRGTRPVEVRMGRARLKECSSSPAGTYKSMDCEWGEHNEEDSFFFGMRDNLLGSAWGAWLCPGCSKRRWDGEFPLFSSTYCIRFLGEH